MSNSRFFGRQSLLKVNYYPQQQQQPNPVPDPSIPLRGRPPKRIKLEQLSAGLRHQHSSSFIMKLFDRSVDLAKFDADSQLYPVCRAWMRNQPRVRVVDPEKKSGAATAAAAGSFVSVSGGAETTRDPMLDVVDRFNRKEIEEIRQMPKPSVGDDMPFVFEERFKNDNFSEKLEELEGFAERRDFLLSSHKTRWGGIRRRWQKRRQNYLRKYQLSYDLLDAMIMKQV